MPAKLYYPTQQPTLPPNIKLVQDDSYFLLRLHDGQTILRRDFRWGEAGTLLLKTSVQSAIHKQSVTGLYKVQHFPFNRATRLAAQIDLTDWLPAYGGDSLRLELLYILIRNEPLRQLLNKMAEIDLSTKLTAVKWEVGVGVKITEMLGYMFSYLLQEGQAEQIFQLQTDLNVEKLQAGFVVAIEAHQAGIVPTEFTITERQDLVLKNQFGYPLEDVSYAVLEIIPRKRLNEREWRETAWGQILQEGYNDALRSRAESEAKKEEAWKKFVEVCYYAGKFATTDLRFIRRHVNEIMADLERNLKREFFGQESFTFNSYLPLSETMQQIFNVETQDEIEALVEQYREALADTRAWLIHYGIIED